MRADATHPEQVADLLDLLVLEPNEERRRALAAEVAGLVADDAAAWHRALAGLEQEVEELRDAVRVAW